MFSHAKKETARIIGQIQGSYNNSRTLVSPTINQLDFEKAVTEDKTRFFFDDVIKAFAEDNLKKAESEKDEIKKSEILSESTKEFSCLEKINVVFDNVTKSFFVDVIDTETRTYKDNAINRKFERVGLSAVK